MQICNNIIEKFEHDWQNSKNQKIQSKTKASQLILIDVIHEQNNI
jgi:hypothetical protein